MVSHKATTNYRYLYKTQTVSPTNQPAKHCNHHRHHKLATEKIQFHHHSKCLGWHLAVFKYSLLLNRFDFQTYTYIFWNCIHTVQLLCCVGFCGFSIYRQHLTIYMGLVGLVYYKHFARCAVYCSLQQFILPISMAFKKMKIYEVFLPSLYFAVFFFFIIVICLIKVTYT